MSDDSGDCTDDYNRPTCSSAGCGGSSSSNNAVRNNRRNHNNDQKRKRRIVMRIEFDDDTDGTSASDHSSNAVTGDDDDDDDVAGDDVDLDMRPSCSTTARRSKRKSVSASESAFTINKNHHQQPQQHKTVNAAGAAATVDVAADSSDISDDEFRNNTTRRLRNNRRSNRLNFDASHSEEDASTSGSEINQRRQTRGKRIKKYVISEDEHCNDDQPCTSKALPRDVADADGGFSSDSSSNELLEKCPICLLTFRQQEIGTPATCQHIFCAACIEAWSRNVQTCPIDRLEFDRIVVRASYENRAVVREINIDPNKASKELSIEDEAAGAEDVTNCEICNSPEREEVMLLCDSCNQGYHIYCLDPPLTEVPDGSWYCDNCFDSHGDDEETDSAEDLSMLYEDIRDMGIPETRLRVREVQQPRILRTRQNERIRAAVLRRTRSNATETTTETTTTTRRSRSSTTTMTTTTRTTTRSTSRRGTRPTTTRRRRRRRTRHRTYVVEYDLNNYDEKFAIQTTKKVIRRRRKKRRCSRRARTARSANASGQRMSASKRLAEQMGVKVDRTHSSDINGVGPPTLSLFGNANDLEYFSDSDPGDAGLENQIQIDTGHGGTAVQTSVRISSVAGPRSRKALLLGKLQNSTSSSAPNTNAPNINADILSSIMDMQDRWHCATRNLSQIQINHDGSLNLPNTQQTTVRNVTTNEPLPTRESTTRTNTTNGPQQDIMEAPMYSRGGSGSNFNTGRGGSGGNYHNRNFGNSGNYRGGSGGQYQRHSTGGMMNSNSGGGGGAYGNQNFNNTNAGNNQNSNNNQNPNQNQNPPFIPFNLRFNQRNQNNNQMNNQQQHQHQLQQRQSVQNRNTNFNQPAQRSMPQALHTPTNFGPNMPPTNLLHLPSPQQQQRSDDSNNQLFAGLPAPTNRMPPIAPVPSITLPPILSVPPPPVPPPGLQATTGLQPPNLSTNLQPPPWNSSLFKLTADYGNQSGGGADDDDEDSCPNFSVYSQESQEVAKATELTQNDNAVQQTAKDDDDMNEDLVQLDDDDDIPMPPDEPPQKDNDKTNELYEPENPTEENNDDDDDDDDNDEEKDNDSNNADDDATRKKVDNAIENDEEKIADDSINRRAENAKKNESNIEIEPQAKVEAEDVSDDEDENVAAIETDNVNNANVAPSVEPVMSPSQDTNSSHADVVAISAVSDSTPKYSDDDDDNDNDDDDAKDKDKEKLKPTTANNRCTPSPNSMEMKLPENEHRVADSRKGVLELYDDSDWEELDIDKPKEYEKAVANSKEANENVSVTDSATNEPDRSYTPCLDEKNEDQAPDVTPSQVDSVDAPAIVKKSDAPQKASEKERVGDIETELISEDDIDSDEHRRRSRSRRRYDSKSRRNSSRRDKENVGETFKKVSKKGRNYRGDKQQTDRKRSTSRSLSRSRSPRARRPRTRSRSLSHSPSRSRSRFRSRSRTRTRSRSISGSHSRSRSPRSRNRPFHKDYNRGRSNFGARGNGRFYNGRFQRGQYHPMRPKRRELPRYDVRNVVASSRNHHKDRYGRDTNRQIRSRSGSFDRRQRSRSFSRSHSRSRMRSKSPKRGRSFSISPTPPPPVHHHMPPAPHRRNSISPRRFGRSPMQRSITPPIVARPQSPIRPRSFSPVPMHSRSVTPVRINGRKPVQKRIRESPVRHSPLYSPRYTPRLSRSRSPSPSRSRSKTPKKLKKKKKKTTKKHKKKKVPAGSVSPARNRRISRQRDPFENDDDDLLQQQQQQHKKSRRHSPKSNANHWSPSPSLTPARLSHMHLDKNTSWTPPMRSPLGVELDDELDPFGARLRHTTSKGKKDKRKRNKKKKKIQEKQRQLRKEKRSKRLRTQTPEPLPSKEVFASGNNILVSVSFNKEANNASGVPPQQTTVVTVPATREDLVISNRRVSIDRLTNSSLTKRGKTKKRKKLEAKPVAIIDLERSPFQVHQEPADVIVLTDSEDANDNLSRRERRRSESTVERNVMVEHHRNRTPSSAPHEKTPPVERLETIMETSYDNVPQSTTTIQTGPKTPPEPPIVKFTLNTKKTHKGRTNPLLDEDDMNSDTEMNTRETHEEHQVHEQIGTQKIGPNTPPESGPCSPDAYDPFEPTKSPSMSPRSPTPTPIDKQQVTLGGDVDAVQSTQKHGMNDDLPQTTVTNTGNVSQPPALNPVDLVMALMNSKSNNAADLANKSNDSQYSATGHHLNNTVSSTDDSMREKSDDAGNTITVLSNVLLTSASNPNATQHIPVISSPTPPSLVKKLSITKPGGSVGSSSSINIPSTNLNHRNGNSGSGGVGVGVGVSGGSAVGLDDSFNMEIESPYSPGSADYEDLFEPPPDNSSSMRRSKRGTGGGGVGGGKAEMFDNLFGSSSPVVPHRMSAFNSTKKATKTSNTTGKSNERKTRGKVGKTTEDHIKAYEDVPNSAVDLQLKDKFLRKLNRQERVVEEVKLVLKPHFNKKHISKEDYKEIMRRAVPKICHSRSGEINPHKIKNLIDAYVKKFRAKHKKLNPLNTGQVSSAVKCAAYLKKL